MKYLLSIYMDEGIPAGRSPEEAQKIMAAWDAVTAEARDAGTFVAGEGLQPTATATTVRFEGTERTITDGPFAETKEQLGGFYLLECKDLDEAIAWAAKVPLPDEEPIEIRPVMDYTGTSYEEVERPAEARS